MWMSITSGSATGVDKSSVNLDVSASVCAMYSRAHVVLDQRQNNKTGTSFHSHSFRCARNNDSDLTKINFAYQWTSQLYSVLLYLT